MFEEDIYDMIVICWFLLSMFNNISLIVRFGLMLFFVSIKFVQPLLLTCKPKWLIRNKLGPLRPQLAIFYSQKYKLRDKMVVYDIQIEY